MEVGPELLAVMANAKAALVSGNAREACRSLREHQDEGWSDGHFLALLGAACCMAGHPADGVAALERALEIAPSPHAHFNLGQAVQAAGDVDRAKECYEHAISLDPTYGNALHALEALVPHDAVAPDFGGRHIEVTGDFEVSEHAHLLTDPSLAYDDESSDDTPPEAPPVPWAPPPE